MIQKSPRPRITAELLATFEKLLKLELNGEQCDDLCDMLFTALKVPVWDISSTGIRDAEPSNWVKQHPELLEVWNAVFEKAQTQITKLRLAEAKQRRDYCLRLVERPELSGIGTGCDPESRQRDLDRAQAKVDALTDVLRDE